MLGTNREKKETILAWENLKKVGKSVQSNQVLKINNGIFSMNIFSM